MKKITAIFTACVCLCLILAACSGDSSSSSKAETSAPDAAVESSQADESSETETTPVTTPEESSEPEETSGSGEETTTATAQEESSSQEDSSEEEIKLPGAEDIHTMAIDIISDAHNNHATIKDGVYKNGDGSNLSNAIDANLDDRGYSDVDYEVEVTGEKVTKVSINGEETLY